MMNKSNLAVWQSALSATAAKRLPLKVEHFVIEDDTAGVLTLSSKLEDLTRLDDLILDYLFLAATYKDDFSDKLCEELIIARMQVMSLDGAELKEHIDESLLSTGLVHRVKRMKVMAKYRVKILDFSISDTTRARIEKECGC